MSSENAIDRDALGASEKSNRAADRALIAHITAQIQDLENFIGTLRIEKNQAQKRLDSYTYPVLNLPNEIFSEIFLHFLPVYPLVPPLKGLLSPNLLTHICRKWRDIAHATPALWGAISFQSTEPSHDGEDNQILLPWIIRSRSCTLSIQVGLKNDYEEPSECIESLALHRMRWEYLELSWVPHDILLSFLCDPMPSLRHLDVSFQQACDTIALGEAPLLRSVRLVVYADILILPWRQLSSLALLSFYPYEATAILKQTPFLVNCELSFSAHSDDSHQLDIELPCLRTFVLLEEEELQIPYLYRLILPALHTLQISESDLGPFPIQDLTSFLSKSGCTLRDLRITEDLSVSMAAYRRVFPTIAQFSFPDSDDEEESESDGEQESELDDEESESDSED
ncbi:hypothetical protein C8R43DRAFT_580367 [Mycena crocata]|nr:hypothetical protein C8R43DRAFT_580367 [Mycena crocata]